MPQGLRWNVHADELPVFICNPLTGTDTHFHILGSNVLPVIRLNLYNRLDSTLPKDFSSYRLSTRSEIEDISQHLERRRKG